MNTRVHIARATSQPERVATRLLTLFCLSGLVFTTACAGPHFASRSIYESQDTVVRLESANRIFSADGANYSHPVLLTNDHIDILLTSISARTKVGLLRSMIGTPGTPRLFSQTDIELLKRPLHDALAQAGSDDAVVFYREKNRTRTHALVASGVLFVRDEVLVLHVANFWHPVITVASDVGNKDRLQDVRETTAYVRDHAWVSVGEQDFAVFFDDPRHQLSRKESSLWAHPERTIAIAYPSYLQANPDPIIRAKESEEAVQQASLPKAESQAIADLRKRLAGLERANADLTDKGRSASDAPHSAAPSQYQTEQASTDKLLEAIQRLENRIAEMEERLRTKSRKIESE